MSSKPQGPYTVELLESDGCVLSSDEVDTLSQARTRAREYITDEEYLAAGAHKVEVRSVDGTCEFDLFAQQVAA